MKNHDYDIAKILVQKPGINLDIIDQNGISFPFILLNSENLELIEQIVKVLKNQNQFTYDYVKLNIGYFSNRIPVWEGIFTLENLT